MKLFTSPSCPDKCKSGLRTGLHIWAHRGSQIGMLFVMIKMVVCGKNRNLNKITKI